MTRVQVGDESLPGNPTCGGRNHNGQPLNYVLTLVLNAWAVNGTFVPFGARCSSRLVNGSPSCFHFRKWTTVLGKRQLNQTPAFSERYEHHVPMFLLLR